MSPVKLPRPERPCRNWPSTQCRTGLYEGIDEDVSGHVPLYGLVTSVTHFMGFESFLSAPRVPLRSTLGFIPSPPSRVVLLRGLLSVQRSVSVRFANHAGSVTACAGAIRHTPLPSEESAYQCNRSRRQDVVFVWEWG